MLTLENAISWEHHSTCSLSLTETRILVYCMWWVFYLCISLLWWVVFVTSLKDGSSDAVFWSLYFTAMCARVGVHDQTVCGNDGMWLSGYAGLRPSTAFGFRWTLWSCSKRCTRWSISLALPFISLRAKLWRSLAVSGPIERLLWRKVRDSHQASKLLQLPGKLGSRLSSSGRFFWLCRLSCSTVTSWRLWQRRQKADSQVSWSWQTLRGNTCSWLNCSLLDRSVTQQYVAN